MNLNEQVNKFEADGFLILPGMLRDDEVASLRAGLEEAFSRDDAEAAFYRMADMWRAKMFERGPQFEALIDHPATIDLLEAILGADCHLIANSALKTGPGQGISFWHADETVRFPRPDDVPLDPRIPMPCFVLNCNYYLCDVDEDLGPTQFVPGSHRSGRAPVAEDNGEAGNPSYAGRSAVSALGPAGTLVLWHDQTWHRGAPNTSADRTRWVQQAAYGRRFIAQRFYPFVNYHMPEEILERANPRRRRLLGIHGPGAYG